MAPGRDSQALLLNLLSLLYQKGSRLQLVTVVQSEFPITPHQLRHAAFLVYICLKKLLCFAKEDNSLGEVNFFYQEYFAPASRQHLIKIISLRIL